MTEEAKRCVPALQWLISYYPKWHEEADPCAVMEDAISLIESLFADLERVTRERDALLEGLRGDCGICTHWQECIENDYALDRNYNSCWQWRGVKNDGP